MIIIIINDDIQEVNTLIYTYWTLNTQKKKNAVFVLKGIDEEIDW